MNPQEDKILILSTEDKEGGAVMRTMNIVEALRSEGYNTALLVKKKHTSLPYVYEVPVPPRPSRIHRFLKSLCASKKTDICREADQKYCVFYHECETAQVYSSELVASTSPFVPTLIISCMTKEFVNTTTLLELHKLWNVPIMLDAYDMNVFTGACHVVWDCKGYETDCTNCPAILNIARRKEVSESFAIRKRNIDEGKMGVMIASEWSATKARMSTLFHDKVICNMGMWVNTDLYNNKNRDIAKRIFGIPTDAKVVFTGSEDIKSKRKGVQFFFKSLVALWEQLEPSLREKVYVLLAGNSIEEMREKIKNLPPFQYKLIEYINDSRLLALTYQAADVFVCPSQEDAGPQMVAEALASGTPVVGFPTGIMYDQSFVINGETGYVVDNNNTEQMGAAIAKILSYNNASYNAMSKKCRTIATQKLSVFYSLKQFQNFDFSNLYQEITQ